MNCMKHAIAAIALGAFAGTAAAVPVTAVSYDMPNGSGQASGGTYNYWDASYSGSGNVTLDGAALSGGTGDLTDGITTNLNWNNIENAAGTGPYVGWRSNITPDPVVRFDFGGSVLISSVTVHMDDSNGTGNVQTPLSIDLSTDGVTYTSNAITDPVSSSPFNATLPLLEITNQLFVRFTHRDQWIFIDEVTFDGERPNAVPEPALPALLGLGLVALGISRKRRGAG
jgi:hypothetical protein